MADQIREALQRLAAQTNQLPEADRAEILSGLGEYTHDLKHTLGLVMGANVLISRLSADEPQVAEMAEIINTACGQLDKLVTMMVEELNDRIVDGG